MQAVSPVPALLRAAIRTKTPIPGPRIASGQRMNSTTSSSSKSSHSIKLSSGGSKKWEELSTVEKAVRTSYNASSILSIAGGVVVIGGVSYFLYEEVFGPASHTVWFNKAVKRIKEDKRCTDILGNASTISAYGEGTTRRNVKNRPIARQNYKDQSGNDHLVMHFNVEGDYNKGVVRLHVTKEAGKNEYAYKFLVLEVPGKEPIYLEDNILRRRKGRDNKGFLGIQWTWNR